MYSKSIMNQRAMLKGEDALDLLHRISTVDLKRLKPGQKTLALILNPQGKIRVIFNIMVLNSKEVEVEFDVPFLEILSEFTFGEQYEMIPLSPPIEAEPKERERILGLVPKLGVEFKCNGETNPLEVNLRSAIHDQKGCYPGQEVVEKIISLGSPAKKLCLFEGVLENIDCPAKLFNESGLEAGTLTSYRDGIALGILKRPFLHENEIFLVQSQKITLRKISNL